MLSNLFLEHVLSVLNKTSAPKNDFAKGEGSSQLVDYMEDDILHAAVFALTSFFRYVWSLMDCLLLHVIVIF